MESGLERTESECREWKSRQGIRECEDSEVVQGKTIVTQTRVGLAGIEKS